MIPNPTKQTTPQQALFAANLPKKPYHSNDLSYGLRIRAASEALEYRYIQANAPVRKLWLMYDIDRPTCPYELTDELLLPAPTLFIQNRENGHAHILYALEVPVHFSDESSAKAMRFAGAVDVALSGALGADAGYVGLVCKNPLHDHWRTYGIAGAVARWEPG
ncbi:MAG: hypothetical protein EOM03_17985 [Clostridia bacterium]|nr:hypothetical protein [Clostridia bacterium]